MTQSSSISHTSEVGLSVVVDPGRLWPVLALRGVMAIIFGLFALLWPGITVFALALLFGAYALIDGVGLLAGAFRHHRGQPVDRLHRLAHLAGGLLGIAAAALTILWPAITVLALALTVILGVYALVFGAVLLALALRLRRQARATAAGSDRP
jgi:uncharacterized membrane protein HdeD (DUF308 family)